MAKKQRLHFCEGEPIVDLLEEIYAIEIDDNTNEEAWAVSFIAALCHFYVAKNVNDEKFYNVET